MMTREILQTKSIDELRAILTYKGFSYHHKEKIDTLIDRIVTAEFTTQPDDKKAEIQVQPKEIVDVSVLTGEEVFYLTSDLVQSKNLKVVINSQENTWQFSCRGREDSGNLKIPKTVLRRIAEQVSKGGFAPAKIDFEGDKVLSI